MSTTITPDQVLSGYTRFWNTGAGAERTRIAAQVFTDDVAYRAPLGVLTGSAALAGFRDDFVGHVGAASLTQIAEPDQVRDHARIRWEIVLADGTAFAAGTDVLAFADDGRIASVTAFLDRAPDGGVGHPDE